MSDLHAAMERLSGVDRATLDYMLGKFENSPQFARLAAATREDYRYCRSVLQGFLTKIGIPFAELRRSSITQSVIQRMVDTIGVDHPSKANHVKRYLSAAYTWAGRRMSEPANPAKGVEQAAERKAPTIPSRDEMRAFIVFLRERGSLSGRQSGALPSYLWAAAEIAYRCRMRGVELMDLTDDCRTDVGVIVRRRKGSLDNITAWCPSLLEAWEWLESRRNTIWDRRCMPVPMLPSRRRLFVAEDGGVLSRSGLHSAWGRAMSAGVNAGIADRRWGMHALKHRGITDTPGGREVRQTAAGHKTASMTDTYSHELDVYPASGDV